MYFVETEIYLFIFDLTSQTARTIHMVVQLRMWHMSMAKAVRILAL